MSANPYLETCFDYNLVFKTRTLYLCTDIDDESARQFIIGLHLLDQTDGTVNLVINSAGGCVDSGLAIMGAIRQARNPIHVTVLGQASSMAAMIVQMAAYRRMDQLASLMFHVPIHSIEEAHSVNFERRADDAKHLRQLFYAVLEKRTGISRKEWRRWIEFDRFYYANEALKYKLIDEII